MNRNDITVFNLLEEKRSFKYFTIEGEMEKEDAPNGKMNHGQYDTEVDL